MYCFEWFTLVLLFVWTALISHYSPVTHPLHMQERWSTITFEHRLVCFWQEVSKEAIKEDCAHQGLKIFVVHGNEAQDGHSPARVPIITEGEEVLADCKSVAKCGLLRMGFIYAINLSYPSKLKYTFEVFQKLFLQLDVLKMSPEVQSFHKNL